jgi:mRNA-degrading endonuclease RelE of RelBE toxin-antitoxin system
VYKLLYKSSIKKDVKDITDKELQKIIEDIKSLKIDPLPNGVKKIKKSKIIFYRIRKGNYTIGYQINFSKNEIEILFIKRRNER